MVDVLYQDLPFQQRLALCEELSHGPYSRFVNTALLFWPQIKRRDIRILARHIKEEARKAHNIEGIIEGVSGQ